MPKIAPSILSADFTKLGEQVGAALDAGAEYIHVDVMDGHFVPNITIGPLVVKSLRKITDAFLDTHLMIENPERYIPRFAEAGSSLLTVHIETCPDPKPAFKLIRDAGVRVGLTLNPKTPFSAVEPFLDEIDLLLVMTVQPGFGAQSFMADQVPKIERARELRDRAGLKYEIEVDGGIYEATAKIVCAAGANVLVAGNAVFGSGDIRENIRKLRAAGESARR